jgi:hypothetical protein
MFVIHIELFTLAVLYGLAGARGINPGRLAHVLLAVFLLGVALLGFHAD